MCDQDTPEELADFMRRHADISRRRFGSLALGVGAAALLPRAANALDVSETEVTIKTPDGTCDAYFAHPSTGRHPGVLMWPDAGGLRTAFRQMGRRLAESGYSVLVPNPFYRTNKAPLIAGGGGFNFQDESQRKLMMAAMGSLNAQTHVTDAKALVPWLDEQKSVDTRRKQGTAGYCMGGPMVMRTAAAMAHRIGAGATFHGGALATDKPDSPHLLIPQMKASFLIAIAENDDMKDPAVKDTLRAAFAQAKLAAEIEVYAGTMHGWCPPDSMVYDEEQAEKAWTRLLALLSKALS